jgi:hypothetical protein
MFDLTFLGTSASVPSAERNHPGLLVEAGGHRIMVDCGEGTQRQLLRSGVGFRRLDRLLLTHGHLDHVLGIPGLFSTLRLRQSTDVMTIQGSPGTLDVVVRKLAGLWGEGRAPIPLQLVPLAEGRILDAGEFKAAHDCPSHELSAGTPWEKWIGMPACDASTSMCSSKPSIVSLIPATESATYESSRECASMARTLAGDLLDSRRFSRVPVPGDGKPRSGLEHADPAGAPFPNAHEAKSRPRLRRRRRAFLEKHASADASVRQPSPVRAGVGGIEDHERVGIVGCHFVDDRPDEGDEVRATIGGILAQRCRAGRGDADERFGEAAEFAGIEGAPDGATEPAGDFSGGDVHLEGDGEFRAFGAPPSACGLGHYGYAHDGPRRRRLRKGVRHDGRRHRAESRMGEEEVVQRGLDAVHVFRGPAVARRQKVLHAAPGDRRERVSPDGLVDGILFQTVVFPRGLHDDRRAGMRRLDLLRNFDPRLPACGGALRTRAADLAVQLLLRTVDAVRDSVTDDANAVSEQERDDRLEDFGFALAAAEEDEIDRVSPPRVAASTDTMPLRRGWRP